MTTATRARRGYSWVAVRRRRAAVADAGRTVAGPLRRARGEPPGKDHHEAPCRYEEHASDEDQSHHTLSVPTVRANAVNSDQLTQWLSAPPAGVDVAQSLPKRWTAVALDGSPVTLRYGLDWGPAWAWAQPVEAVETDPDLRVPT